MLPNLIPVVIILSLIPFRTQAQKTSTKPLDSTAYAAKDIIVHGARCTGYIKHDTFFLSDTRCRTILESAGLYATWEFEDFDGDGSKDILLVHGGNTPGLMDLYLYRTGANRFVPVRDFASFPAPERIKGTPYYYSYHHSGCADENWDSDLFYLQDFKAICLGNISGVVCTGDTHKEAAVSINKVRGNRLIFIRKYPISVIERYKDHKWGLIKQFWQRNYKLFLTKELLASKGYFITEKFAMDTAMHLPEVKESNDYIRRYSSDKRLLFPMLYGEPDSLHPYYWVAVGEDNGVCFVTHFTFYVYANSGRIVYSDPVEEVSVDLESWRKNRFKGRPKYLHGTYSGLWAETIRTYSFVSDHFCNFTTKMHFGYTSTKCRYTISDDTVFVKSLPAGKQKDKDFLSIKDTLYIGGNICLFDKNREYKYCKRTSDTLYSQDH